MSTGKRLLMTAGGAALVSLMVSSLMMIPIACFWGQRSFELLDSVCGYMVEQDPEAGRIAAAAVKKAAGEGSGEGTDRKILEAWGYDRSDFALLSVRQVFWPAAAGGLAGLLLSVLVLGYGERQKSKRIRALTDYLEQVNLGRAGVLTAVGEDEFSGLEDEIYKTVTFLYQTRDEAVERKNEFAHNLSNIAHQIKTPITAISLSVQAMEREYGKECLEPIQRQLLRLTHLEEALLILSRLDAGVLVLEKRQVDVFTLLVLAADNLEELFRHSQTSVKIQELGEMVITADLEWTMEAVMNLMKNCMEHNRGGCVHCDYGQNPLYTEIRIWDEGRGFDKEDLPYLFRRFYRGKHESGGGIGIGLALAKEIVERQNGVIKAKNMPEGGACFEIRFYGRG